MRPLKEATGSLARTDVWTQLKPLFDMTKTVPVGTVQGRMRTINLRKNKGAGSLYCQTVRIKRRTRIQTARLYQEGLVPVYQSVLRSPNTRQCLSGNANRNAWTQRRKDAPFSPVWCSLYLSQGLAASPRLAANGRRSHSSGDCRQAHYHTQQPFPWNPWWINWLSTQRYESWPPSPHITHRDE